MKKLILAGIFLAGFSLMAGAQSKANKKSTTESEKATIEQPREQAQMAEKAKVELAQKEQREKQERMAAEREKRELYEREKSGTAGSPQSISIEHQEKVKNTIEASKQKEEERKAALRERDMKSGKTMRDPQNRRVKMTELQNAK